MNKRDRIAAYFLRQSDCYKWCKPKDGCNIVEGVCDAQRLRADQILALIKEADCIIEKGVKE